MGPAASPPFSLARSESRRLFPKWESNQVTLLFPDPGMNFTCLLEPLRAASLLLCFSNPSRRPPHTALLLTAHGGSSGSPGPCSSMSRTNLTHSSRPFSPREPPALSRGQQRASDILCSGLLDTVLKCLLLPPTPQPADSASMRGVPASQGTSVRGDALGQVGAQETSIQ